MATLFGKPRGEVVRHPGAFKKAAEHAGESTAQYAEEKKHVPGRLGREARLAQTFAKMRGK